MHRSRRAILLAIALLWLGRAALADEALHRTTVWDLVLGAPIAAQPAAEEFQAFACGSNGGPPHLPLKGWNDFRLCPAEPSGLREVYFEYDDELEYIARARDLESEITRWAGTAEARFPIVASALFDAQGSLAAIRIVTDSRPEHRNDITDADLHKREEAYLLGTVMAARFGIDAAKDCISLPLAEGESAVGSSFIKQQCEKTDSGRMIRLRVSLYRKPGQSGVNPQAPTQLTKGQFESSTRLEIERVEER
jgi:hypothetical protein